MVMVVNDTRDGHRGGGHGCHGGHVRGGRDIRRNDRVGARQGGHLLCELPPRFRYIGGHPFTLSQHRMYVPIGLT